MNFNRPVLNTADIEVERVKIASKKVTEPVVLLHLSDLHFRRRGRLEENLISNLSELEYDLALLTGDYIDNLRRRGSFQELLVELDLQAPAFAVPGNHDYRDNLTAIREDLETAGIRFLNNHHHRVKVKNMAFNIIGVGCPRVGVDDFQQAAGSAELESGFNLVISHTYDVVEGIKRSASADDIDPVDLVLVGDTHGGQINLPVIRFFYDLIYSQDYISGLFQPRDSGVRYLYVNRGLGASALPIRINCPPEIALIEIEPEN